MTIDVDDNSMMILRLMMIWMTYWGKSHKTDGSNWRHLGLDRGRHMPDFKSSHVWYQIITCLISNAVIIINIIIIIIIVVVKVIVIFVFVIIFLGLMYIMLDIKCLIANAWYQMLDIKCCHHHHLPHHRDHYHHDLSVTNGHLISSLTMSSSP